MALLACYRPQEIVRNAEVLERKRATTVSRSLSSNSAGQTAENSRKPENTGSGAAAACEPSL
jgi:hypothetical protein